MKLANLDQKIFVPIVDDANGTSYEIEITIADLLSQTLEEFNPEFVEAIPINWLKENAAKQILMNGNPFKYVLSVWK